MLVVIKCLPIMIMMTCDKKLRSQNTLRKRINKIKYCTIKSLRRVKIYTNFLIQPTPSDITLAVGAVANEYDDSHAFCKWQLDVEKNNKSGKYEEKHGEEQLDEGYVLGLDTRI